MSSRLTASSGTFEKFPFKQVFCDAALLRYSGTLALIHPLKKKSLMFQNGKIVSSRSSLAQESTLQYLMDIKKISSQNLRVVMAELENQESMAQLEVLVKRGLIVAADIQEIVDRLVDLRVKEVFTWSEGRFAFVDQLPKEVILTPHSQDTLDLLLRLLTESQKHTFTEKDVFQVDATDLSYLLDSLKVLPFKLQVMIQKSIQNKQNFSCEQKDQLKFVSALADLGWIKVKKIEVSENAKVSSASLNSKDLNSKLATLKQMDHYSILQLKRDAKESEIKKNFLALAKQYHPDSISPETPQEIRKLAEDIFSIISQSSATLLDPQKKEEYDSSLNMKESGFDAMKAEQLLEAEFMYQRAEALAKKGDFVSASDELQKAIAINNTEPEYYMLFGWCLFKDSFAKKNMVLVRKAKEQLSKSLAMRPTLFQAYFYQAQIAKSEGEIDQAKKLFEKTLSLKPGHTEANSELRVLNMREQKTSGLKSFLQKKKS